MLGRKKVYVIILNWNGTNDTIACLESFKHVKSVDFQLIIVDNNSDNHSYQELYQWCFNKYGSIVEYSQLEAEDGGRECDEKLLDRSSPYDGLLIIKNNENLGFAAGNNVALRYILAKRDISSYSLLLNNDTVVEPDFLYHLFSFMQNHEVYVACTPQIRLFEPNDRIWNCGGDLKWFGNRKYLYANSHISSVPIAGYKDVSYVTGCSLFFKPDITGILTEKFFFGEEDMDFSLRQKKAGNKMACVFESIIYHKVHASVGKISGKVNLGKVYLFYLMRFIDNRQYVPKWLYIIQVFINILYAVPMIVVRYKASFSQVFRLFVKLLKELKMIDSVDKKRCLELLNSPII